MTTDITDYMGLWELLSDEEKLVQQTAREFVNREVIPIIDGYAQEEKFPAHLVKAMGNLGFLGPTLPEEYNCAGLSNVAYGILMYELERGGFRDTHFCLGSGFSCHVSDICLWQ